MAKGHNKRVRHSHSQERHCKQKTTKQPTTTTICPPEDCPNLKQWDQNQCACVCPSLPADQLCADQPGACSIIGDCECACITLSTSPPIITATEVTDDF